MENLNLKPGDKVIIKYTGQHCYGLTSTNIEKEVKVVLYRKDFMEQDGSMRKGVYDSYNTFKDNKGKLISFAAHQNEDYIIKILDREPTYEIY